MVLILSKIFYTVDSSIVNEAIRDNFQTFFFIKRFYTQKNHKKQASDFHSDILYA